MRLEAANTLSPDVYARLVAVAAADIGPGRWYCLPADASRRRQEDVRPWLVMAYSPREGSPVALVRPASSCCEAGALVNAHAGRHHGPDAETCRLGRQGFGLTLGEVVPLPVLTLGPGRYSCREPEFARVHTTLGRRRMECRQGPAS